MFTRHYLQFVLLAVLEDDDAGGQAAGVDARSHVVEPAQRLDLRLSSVHAVLAHVRAVLLRTRLGTQQQNMPHNWNSGDTTEEKSPC